MVARKGCFPRHTSTFIQLSTSTLFHLQLQLCHCRHVYARATTGGAGKHCAHALAPAEEVRLCRSPLFTRYGLGRAMKPIF